MRKYALLAAVLALLGFLDASFLTAEHFRGLPPPCVLLQGCEEVTTSRFSSVFGIPVALAGSLYYAAILLLAVLYLDRGEMRAIRAAGWLARAGLLASAWFVYVQLGILKAVCLYCMLSAGITLLLVLATFKATQKNHD